MGMTIPDALASTPPDQPKPATHKPATAAFQRRLAEQHAAARNAPEPAPPRPAVPARAAPQAAPQTRGGERGLRAAVTLDVAGGGGAAAFVACGGAWEGGGQGGGQGNLGGASASQAGEGDLDCAMLLDLLPGDGASVIFQLLLPGGEHLAVVADITAREAAFLLTPSSERLRRQLNLRKMELEKGLMQRMDRHVRLTVLD